MNESGLGCLVVVFEIVVTAIIYIVTGILVWNWIDPSGFWSFLLFLILWYGLAKLIGEIVGLILAIIASFFE